MLCLVLLLGTAGLAMSGFRGHLGHFGKGSLKERMIAPVDYTMQELKLTAEQQAKYGRIRARMIDNMESAEKRHRALRTVIDTELGKEQPDMASLATTLKKEIRTMPDGLIAQIDSMLEIYAMLDSSQQQKVVSMLKEHSEHKAMRRPFMDGPPPEQP